MKLFILFFLFLICPFAIFSQNANNSIYQNEQNVYYQAFKKYIEYIKKSENRTVDTLYVEYQDDITDSLKTEVEGVKIVSLKSEEIERYFKSRKSLLLNRIRHLQFFNEQFFIFITPFSVGRKGRKYNYLFSGDYRVSFSFSNSQFGFKKVEKYSF